MDTCPNIYLFKWLWQTVPGAAPIGSFTAWSRLEWDKYLSSVFSALLTFSFRWQNFNYHLGWDDKKVKNFRLWNCSFHHNDTAAPKWLWQIIPFAICSHNTGTNVYHSQMKLCLSWCLIVFNWIQIPKLFSWNLTVTQIHTLGILSSFPTFHFTPTRFHSFYLCFFLFI